MKKTIPKRSPDRKKKDNVVTLSSIAPFYVVGIGASAGGLDALEKFFGTMPENTGWHLLLSPI